VPLTPLRPWLRGTAESCRDIYEPLGRNMLEWRHSRFKVDLDVKIAAASSKAREDLTQYIACPPVSLKKMLVEEHAGSVLYRSEYNPNFRTDSRLFPATKFLVEVLQHFPDAVARLIPWAAAGCFVPRSSPTRHPGSVSVRQGVPCCVGSLVTLARLLSPGLLAARTSRRAGRRPRTRPPPQRTPPPRSPR